MRFTRVSLVTPEPIGKPEAAGCQVLTSREELLTLYKVSDCQPALDFDRCFLLAVHRGCCPTGGYGVRVAGLEQQGDQVTVRLVYQNPRPGDFVTLAITYPRELVQVERSELRFGGRLRFRFVDERSATLAEVTADIS